jgi:Fuc2NAc and GlcNAc transferase
VINLAGFVGVAIVTCLVAWIGTRLVREHAIRSGILDVPNERSSHTTPTARGGGLAIVLVFSGLVLTLLSVGLLAIDDALVLVVGGGAIALVGHLDDRRTLPSWTRFCVHIAAAILAVLVIGGITERTLRSVGMHGIWAGSVLGVLGVAWTVNLFNFMDGIDGIAGCEAIFIAAAGAWLNWMHGGDPGLTATMVGLAGATFGFLIFNWPPARIFMGDVGSGFLGFILAILGLAASQGENIPIEAWVILGGVFEVDATVTLLRRVIRGDRWFAAHRMHAYQHVARRCSAHLPVVRAVTAINLCWLLPWAWLASVFPTYGVRFVAIALLPLVVLALMNGAGSNEDTSGHL